MFIISVVIARPIEKCYSYVSRDSLKCGTIVEIPLMFSKSLGIVLECAPLIISQNLKLKEIHRVYGEVPLKYLKILQEEARKQHISLGIFLKNILRIPLNIQSTTRDKISFKNLSLSEDQMLAVDQILQNPTSLLIGVTGSGKTNVYLKVIESFLDGQILVLMPEISLTMDWKKKFQSWFGFEPYIWHHASKNKREIYSWALSGAPGVVVGARSAILLPLKNLKLIIIDEEHDVSYKQDTIPYYHARDLALQLCEKVVLVSATPSVESFFLIKNHVKLSRKPEHGLAQLTLLENYSDAPISLILQTKLLENKALGEASILLINKRGYASYLSCTVCKKIIMCSRCSSKLSVHSEFLLCHWCGWKQLKEICKCGAETSPKGWAIESVNEWISNNLHLKTDFISSDSKSISAKLNKLISGKIDLLIGTQIISQGYNIEKISLVIILDLAGGGYNFRDNERLYQLLSQTRGRAGRGKLPGRAYIQSNTITSNFIKYLDNSTAFYNAELAERKEFNMPPFSTLTSIIFTSKDQQLLEKYIKTTPSGALGPVPAPLFKLNNIYRWRALVVGNPEKYINKLEKKKGIEIIIDNNPYSFY